MKEIPIGSDGASPLVIALSKAIVIAAHRVAFGGVGAAVGDDELAALEEVERHIDAKIASWRT